MADNVTLPATGQVVATDDVGGVQVQYVKLMDGTPDSANKSVINSDGSLKIVQSPSTYSAKSVTAIASGDTTIHTPTNGAAVRLHYICLSASGSNTAPILAVIKFGSTVLYQVSLAPGAMFARNIGAGRYYLQGATNASVVVNLSGVQTVYSNIEYEEI